MNSVRAFAPATVANLSCGFDIFGLCLPEPGDEVVVTRRNSPGLTLRVHGDGGRLPTDVGRNTASVAVSRLLELTGVDAGIDLELHKGLPLASGLGSSAASAVAAVVAANSLLELDAPFDVLLESTLAGEQVASGAAHADNVAPALLGGLVLVRPGDPWIISPLPLPEGLCIVCVHPQQEVETSAARRGLPTSVPRETAVRQAGNVAEFVAALASGDLDRLATAMEDHIAEPIRARLVRGYAAVRDAASSAGGVGCALAGSGPTMFSFAPDPAAGARIGSAMSRAFASAGGCDSEVYVASLPAPGARVVSS